MFILACTNGHSLKLLLGFILETKVLLDLPNRCDLQSGNTAILYPAFGL